MNTNKYSTILAALLTACSNFTGSPMPDSATDAVADASAMQDAGQDSAAQTDASILQDASTPACGDGIVNGTEQCDGQDLAGQTCQTFGFSHGNLACNGSCAVDVQGCNNTTVCGDGVAEGTEECDQNDFWGLWCGDVPGFVAGQLVCTASCTVSTALCLESVCGDEVATSPYEQCDGPDLAGLTCQALGFDGGVLACQDCEPDTTGCTMDPFCGDGVVDPGEECDTIPNGGTVTDVDCTDFGLDQQEWSYIRCWDCSYLPTNCTDCGNGIAEGGEACDVDGNGVVHYSGNTPFCFPSGEPVPCDASTCHLAACL